MTKRNFLSTSLMIFTTLGAAHWASGAVTPFVFPGAGSPVGISATATELLFSTPFCQTVAGTRVLNSLNPVSGAIAKFATLPDQIAGSNLFTTCAENYFAISPGLGSFSSFANYVYVSAVSGGANVILRVTPNGSAASTFVTLPAGFAPVNHAGVAFDSVGTFGNALIVTGQAGIIGYDASGMQLFMYSNPNPSAFALETATVAPLSYAPCPGCLLIGAETLTGGSGEIYAVTPGSPSGTMPVPFSTAPVEPEAITFVPAQTCSVGQYSYFVSGFGTPPSTNAFSTNGSILAFTGAQLASYAGQFLVPDEGSGIIYAFSAPNVSSVFSNTGYQLEGATMVPCAPANQDGRMTGGGSIFTSAGLRVTHGFELHCDTADVPNNLEINFGGDRFHLDTLLSASCYTNPLIDSGHPAAPFNTYVGFGTGTYDGVPGATALWTFTDAGEPGKNDTATITIRNSSGMIVLTATGTLDSGNQQAHTDNN